MTLKIIRLYELIIGNICATFDQNTLKDLPSFAFKIFQMWPDFWPRTLKINRIDPLVIGNICASLDQNTLNGLIYIVFARLHSLLPVVT